MHNMTPIYMDNYVKMCTEICTRIIRTRISVILCVLLPVMSIQPLPHPTPPAAVEDVCILGWSDGFWIEEHI